MSKAPPGTVTAVANEVIRLSIDTGLPFDDFRAWFTHPDADAPAWYRAHGDSVVGPVLRPPRRVHATRTDSCADRAERSPVLSQGALSRTTPP
jgi:hypothetical protein